MPTPNRPANIGFDFSFAKTKPSASTPIDEDTPLRIAILGHFGSPSGEASTPVRIDCDNFDTACAQFGASLHLPPDTTGAPELELTFRSLDDFHPDQLLKNVPSLVHLTQLRTRLRNPSTANAATAELRDLLTGVSTASAASATTPPPSTESAEDTFARLLGDPTPSPAKPSSPPATPASFVDRLLKQAVAPTASKTPSPEQTQLLTQLDAELSTRLRQLLHHPAFQALESAWRSLDLLVREANDNVEIHVIDLARGELEQQLASGENPAATPIGRQLTALAPFAIISPWTFGAEDTAFLQQLARLAAACGTAIIAGGASDLVGCASFSAHPDPLDWSTTPEPEAFAELRRAPESAHLGLTAPRFLLRLPYAPGTDPIETFPFDEFPTGAAHESYLWGSSAFLCGRLLLNAFADEGWDMDLNGTGGELGSLPVHTFESGGETQVKPCAEAWLTDKAAEHILRRGLIPILSVRNSDSAIVVSLRSIAHPAAPLQFPRS